MGLETATFVDDLVSTNPLGTDIIPQGDDHLRLIKAALKATFKGFTRAFYCPNTTSAQTSTVTVATTDQNKLIPVNAIAGDITVNLPAGSTLPDGFEVEIVKSDVSLNLVTIDGSGSETINGGLTQVLYQAYQTTRLQWSASLSAWIGKREYVPAKGEVTPWGGATACPDGWLYPNGTTIGNATSGGTQRAAADCLGLYQFLYMNFSDTICPVTSGRSGSSLATAKTDFDASKAIQLINLAGMSWIGLDNLGGISDRGKLTATTNGANTAGQTNGEAIGSEGAALSTAQLPTHTPTGTVSSHHHSTTAGTVYGGTTFANVVTGAGVQAVVTATDLAGNTTTNTQPTVTMDAIGSGAQHTNIQPSFVSGWKIKL